MNGQRRIVLRDESAADEVRTLVAYIDDAGRLHLDGQEVGPDNIALNDDDERAWFYTFRPAEVARVLALLGGQPGDDLLAILERDWSGPKSHELEKLLRASGIPFSIYIAGGM